MANIDGDFLVVDEGDKAFGFAIHRRLIDEIRWDGLYEDYHERLTLELSDREANVVICGMRPKDIVRWVSEPKPVQLTGRLTAESEDIIDTIGRTTPSE